MFEGVCTTLIIVSSTVVLNVHVHSPFLSLPLSPTLSFFILLFPYLSVPPSLSLSSLIILHSFLHCSVHVRYHCLNEMGLKMVR